MREISGQKNRGEKSAPIIWCVVLESIPSSVWSPAYHPTNACRPVVGMVMGAVRSMARTPNAPLSSLDSVLIRPLTSNVRASKPTECSMSAASLASSTRVSLFSFRMSCSLISRAANTSCFSELRGEVDEFALRWPSRCHALYVSQSGALGVM